MQVFVVYKDYGYEGCSEPLGAYRSLAAAEADFGTLMSVEDYDNLPKRRRAAQCAELYKIFEV